MFLILIINKFIIALHIYIFNKSKSQLNLFLYIDLMIQLQYYLYHYTGPNAKKNVHYSLAQTAIWFII